MSLRSFIVGTSFLSAIQGAYPFFLTVSFLTCSSPAGVGETTAHARFSGRSLILNSAFFFPVYTAPHPSLSHLCGLYFSAEPPLRSRLRFKATPPFSPFDACAPRRKNNRALLSNLGWTTRSLLSCLPSLYDANTFCLFPWLIFYVLSPFTEPGPRTKPCELFLTMETPFLLFFARRSVDSRNYPENFAESIRMKRERHADCSPFIALFK